MRTTPQAVCRVLAILSLVAAGLWSPSLASAAAAPAPAPQSPAPQSYAGPCTDDLGVTVVVDFQQLGGETVVRCAPGSGGQPFQGSGLDAFRAAGLEVTGTSQHGASVVCRVNGRPAADEPLPIPGDEDYTEQCVQMPPAAAFWSYWQADNGGSWAFSQLGVTASTARAGGFEALSFSLNSTSAPPRTAPSRPNPEPPPTQDPEPPPSEDPKPPPSEDPEPPPAETPTPAPSPEPPAPSSGPGPSGGPTAPEAAPTPEATGATTDGPDTEDDTDAAGGESATSTQDPTAGDDTEAATATAAPGDASPSTSQLDDSDDPTTGVTRDEFTDPADDGGGATTLWVTVGILLLLGALGFFVSRSRRRRDGADLTHEVEPWQ